MRVEANVIKADIHGVEIFRKRTEGFYFGTEEKKQGREVLIKYPKSLFKTTPPSRTAASRHHHTEVASTNIWGENGGSVVVWTHRQGTALS